VLLKLAGKVGQAYSYVSDRRKAAAGTYAWGLWLLLWLPLYVLFAWLLDLACLRHRCA
jgi:hypothetical protein